MLSGNTKDSGERYFHAAERQLTAETGRIRLTGVQARLCQCFYLLACSRINHCRYVFGMTTYLIHALGLHRKRRSLTSAGVDPIEHECNKRAFWSSYCLDNYLSSVLGRPSTFHDDDIDQEYPSLINDEDLGPGKQMTPIAIKGQCLMIAPVIHAKLVRILSRILKELYGIQRMSEDLRHRIAAKYARQLYQWREELPAFLDARKVDPSLLMATLQRQSRMLTLAYAHTMILVNRPFLLSNFASLSRRRNNAGDEEDSSRERIEECMNAAMMVADIVNDLFEGKQVFPAFWFTQYVAFCSVVVLYLYTIQRKSDPPQTWMKYLDIAKKCQEQIASAANENSLAQRYGVILEELKAEVDRQTKQARAVTDISTASREDGVESEGNEDMQRFFEVEQQSITPNSQMMEMTGWDEFDSLIMDFGIGLPTETHGNADITMLM